MKEKSVIEQALLQVQTLEEAVKKNAQGILASTMKQELKDLIKEQEDEDENIPDDEEDVPDETGDDDVEPDDDADDMGDDEDVEEPEYDEMGDEDVEEPGEFEDESGEDEETLDMTGASDEEVLTVFKAMKDTDGIVVKAQKQGEDIKLNVDDDEYIIKLNEQEDDDLGVEFGDDEEFTDDEEFGNEDFGNEDFGDEEEFGDENLGGEEDEPIYEITLDDEDESVGEFSEDKDDPYKKGLKGGSGDKDSPFTSGASKQRNSTPGKTGSFKTQGDPFEKNVKKGEFAECDKGAPFTKNVKGMKKVEATEAHRTKDNRWGNMPKDGPKRTGLPSKTKYAAGTTSESMNEQVKILKKQNAEYKKALVLFKDKLNEVAVFNANLAHATRLFTEQTTTKEEKMNILKRFDSVSTISESKNLYTQIKTELGNKKPINESVAQKISTTPTSSSSEVLSEAKAYENPQFKRMKELMFKIK